MVTGQFFGGIASGFQNQEERNTADRALAIKQQQNDIQNQTDATATIDQQVSKTLQIAAQTAQIAQDNGKSPDLIARAIQPIIDSAASLAQRAPNGQDYVKRVQAVGNAILLRSGVQQQSSPGTDTAPAPTAVQPTAPIAPTDTFSPGEIARANPPLSGGTPFSTPTVPITPPVAPLAQAEQTPNFNDRFGNLPPATSSPGADNVVANQEQTTIPGGAGPIQFTETPTFNEDILKDKPAPLAALIKGVANYQIGPKNFSLRQGKDGESERTKILGIVKQYYPDFDERVWNTSQRTLLNFSNGVEARGVRSLNQVFGHIQNWLDDIKELKNFQSNQFGVGTQAANKMRQWVLNNQQDPRVIQVNNDGTAIANELEKAFRGAQTAITGVQEWHKGFVTDLSPQGSVASGQSLQRLLGTALKAYGNQFNQGFKTASGKQVMSRDPMSFLTPESRDIYDTISSGAAFSNVKTQEPQIHRIITPGGSKFRIE